MAKEVTTTVTVFTRHSPGCTQTNPQWKRCYSQPPTTNNLAVDAGSPVCRERQANRAARACVRNSADAWRRILSFAAAIGGIVLHCGVSVRFCFLAGPGSLDPSQGYEVPPSPGLGARMSSMRRRGDIQRKDSSDRSANTPGSSESPRRCGSRPRAGSQSRVPLFAIHGVCL